MTPSKNWYPNVVGKADRVVSEAFRIAFDNLYALRDRIADLAGGGGSVNGISGPVTIAASASINVGTSGATITPALKPIGPGAGTYVVGLKLTGGGKNGTITIDADGRGHGDSTSYLGWRWRRGWS